MFATSDLIATDHEFLMISGARDALIVLINHKQDFLASDRSGATALHMASEGGHLQCVNLLLQHQAGVNVMDKQQYTPLFSACQMGHRDVVETLLLRKPPNLCQPSLSESLSLSLSQGLSLSLSLSQSASLSVSLSLSHLVSSDVNGRFILIDPINSHWVSGLLSGKSLEH